MDINQEKEKAKYIHKLKLRQLIIDKIFFGIIIVLIGLITNVIIEQYRSKLTEQRFILEKRLEAINSIKKAYEDMIDLYDTFTLESHRALPENYEEQYDEKINNFFLQLSRWNVLFPKEFDYKLGNHGWIHLGIKAIGIDTFCKLKDKIRHKHRDFVEYLRRQFLSLCRTHLGLQIEKDQGQFTLEEWSYEKAQELGSKEYYNVNFEKWEKWKD